MQTAPVHDTDTRIPFARVELDGGVMGAVMDVLASGWLTAGPQVAAFEQEFGRLTGAAEAVAVSSCTAALEIALRGLGLRPRAKVLISTMTFCGAVHAIVHAGCIPVLADVNPRTLMPDEETTAAARRRAGPIDAMVVTHFAGHPAPIDALASAAGVPIEAVVEDAAHALGTSVDGRAVGTISRATCFSFYATKNLPIGEGGMITTEDAELASTARRLRQNGMSADAWRRYLPGSGWRYSVHDDGLKANFTDLQAAIGRAQLRSLAGWQAARAELAAIYDAGLAGVPGIQLPARPAAGGHAWHLYVIRVGAASRVSRDHLIAGLSERGIDCSVHFIPIHHHPYFQRLLSSRQVRGNVHADRAFEEIVSLPLYPSLGAGGVHQVCEAIRDLA